MMEGYGTRLEPPPRERLESELRSWEECIEKHKKRKQELTQALAGEVNPGIQGPLKEELLRLDKQDIPHAQGKVKDLERCLKRMNEAGDDG